MNRTRLTGALVLLAAACSPSLATAQADPTPCFETGNCATALPAIPFDILPPGARSLGIGGAFVGVADDATAAEANPAGMTILTRPEISLHGRHASYDVDFLDPNGFDGIGFGADTPNPPIGNLDDSNSTVSFASFVYPFSRFVLAGYYQNSGRIEAGSSIVGFEPEFIDTFVAETFIDAEVESFGLSGAFRISDMFSIGASLKSTSTDVTFVQASTLLDFRDQESNEGQANTIDDELTLAATNVIDDDDFTWNIGLLINPNGKFSAGLVYRENGSYDADQTLIFNSVGNCNGVQTCSLPPSETIAFPSGTDSYDLPDIFSVGLAWRPTDTWLLAFQLDNVGYDDLPDPVDTSLIISEPIATDELNDEWVWHAGVEKVFIFDKAFLGMSLLSLRGGAFSNPDHDGYDQIDTDDTSYTLGLGTVFGERFQVDAAWQFSDQIDTFVMSGVYRF